MSTILVSIISEQTIPNLLLIKELEGQYDDMLFITTKRMEDTGQSRWIEKAADIIENSVKRVIVDPDSIENVTNTLKQEVQLNVEFIVNLTGGTKPMSLAIYQYFTKPKNRIVYLPIGKNEIKEFYPAEAITCINYRLNLKEYLSAYGIFFESLPKEAIKQFDLLKQILRMYKLNGFNSQDVSKEYTSSDANFFTGIWFEQYIYHLLIKQLNLRDNDIETDLKINNFKEKQRAGADNQLDIAFTHNNELYIVEAKVSIGKEKLNKSNLENILFKLSAINRNFGIKSHPYVVTLADLTIESTNFRVDLERKLRVLGIVKIEDRNCILDQNSSICQKKYS